MKEIVFRRFFFYSKWFLDWLYIFKLLHSELLNIQGRLYLIYFFLFSLFNVSICTENLISHLGISKYHKMANFSCFFYFLSERILTWASCLCTNSQQNKEQDLTSSSFCSEREYCGRLHAKKRHWFIGSFNILANMTP